MAGAFDFYVDESLLEELLGGDSGKSKKGGKAKSKLSPSPAPVAVAFPDPSPESVTTPEPAVAASPAPQVVEPAVESTVAEQATPEHPALQLPVPEHPAVVAWREADSLYASGAFESAAQSYRKAAQVTEPADAAQASTLFYNAAICELQSDRFEQAHEDLKLALQASPESRAVRIALALASFRRNLQAEAIEHCDAVLAANSADEDALIGKIQALFSIGEFDKAAEVCEKFRDFHPTSSVALRATLAVCAARKDRPGVEHSAHKLLELEPGSALATKVLAAIAMADRDFESAANHCEALLADPEIDFEACLHAADTLHRSGRTEKAIVAATRAVQLNPQSQEALLKLAESQQVLNLWQEAKDTYQKAVALDPNCPDALWNLSLVFEELGSYVEAAETLTVAVRIRPEWEDASLRLASLNAATGRLQEASAVLEHCLMLRKDWPEALFLSGIVLHQLGQSGPAQDAVLKALELKPDETSWIESLERIAVERDDALVALDCHEKLAESNIETPEMAYNLGVVLQKENEPELAAKCYVRALEQRPDFDLALLNLGYALRDLGREEEARACWGKAVRLDPSLAIGYFQ